MEEEWPVEEFCEPNISDYKVSPSSGEATKDDVLKLMMYPRAMNINIYKRVIKEWWEKLGRLILFKNYLFIIHYYYYFIYIYIYFIIIIIIFSIIYVYLFNCY